MRYDSTIKCSTNGANGVINFSGRYITNFGQIRKKTVLLETPVLFYSNNPAGGEISADEIGAFTYFNYNPDVRSVESIGRFCSFAQNVIIGIGGHSTTALTHHMLFENKQLWAEPFWDYDSQWVETNYRENVQNEKKRSKIGKIGNDVWIGCNSVVLEGVNIGDGAIVAAGSVVTKDVPPYTIVAGVPAKVIRQRFSDEMVERLLKTRWWNYGPNVLKGLQISDPKKCIDKLEERIQNGFPVYKPDKFEIDCAKQTITKIYAEDGRRELVYDFNKKG